MLHKAALGIQEVFRMEVEGFLPDSLILQHRGQVGDEGRPLAGGTCVNMDLGGAANTLVTMTTYTNSSCTHRILLFTSNSEPLSAFSGTIQGPVRKLP